MENNKNRQEFIAKQIADLGKAGLTIGLASYFFERFYIFIRIGIMVVAMIFVVASFFIYPVKRGD